MAAVDYFLKLDGIPGGSIKGEIQLDSWSWGETNSGSAIGSATGGAGAGKVSMQDFHFTSKISKASPLLMLHCANGKHIKEAVLAARRRNQFEFLKYTLEDVLVTSVQEAASGTGDQVIPEDSVSLNFAKISVEFKEQKTDGTPGATVTFQWDLSANKAL